MCCTAKDSSQQVTHQGLLHCCISLCSQPDVQNNIMGECFCLQGSQRTMPPAVSICCTRSVCLQRC